MPDTPRQLAFAKRRRISVPQGKHTRRRLLHVELLEDRRLLASDFGDAPAPYPVTLADDGARHDLVQLAILGASIDIEGDGTESPNADADGADEDGVVFGALSAGKSATVDVTVGNGNGFLDAWIDFNGNGDWSDPGEQVFASEVVKLSLIHI